MHSLLASITEQLNRDCACHFLNQEKLAAQLNGDPNLNDLAADIAASRPHLFSATTVFVTQPQIDAMTNLVGAISTVIDSPAWQQQVVATAPDVAYAAPGARGVCLGFDFHLGPQGPQLIEINTNAGGALLNLALARAQQACCPELQGTIHPATPLADVETLLVDMFVTEWRLQGHSGRPRHIAIVDTAPEQQYLQPEFLLFQRLFQQAGITAHIADPQALQWDGQQLRLEQQPVDLVYNRLTDFYLQAPEHQALLQAYLARACVITPHPHAHAQYANKHNLEWLSNPEALAQLGVAASLRDVLLAGIPQTRRLDPAAADAFWAERKQLFFKPADGFGSRATYRGDKLTRRVWEEILQGDYVAQALVPPGERRVAVAEGTSELKYDVRAYVYDGNIQLFAARLYMGQTTNFRTPGGGFAPIFVLGNDLTALPAAACSPQDPPTACV